VHIANNRLQRGPGWCGLRGRRHDKSAFVPSGVGINGGVNANEGLVQENPDILPQSMRFHTRDPTSRGSLAHDSHLQVDPGSYGAASVHHHSGHRSNLRVSMESEHHDGTNGTKFDSTKRKRPTDCRFTRLVTPRALSAKAINDRTKSKTRSDNIIPKPFITTTPRPVAKFFLAPTGPWMSNTAYLLAIREPLHGLSV
jgi:hypothetical protein